MSLPFLMYYGDSIVDEQVQLAEGDVESFTLVRDAARAVQADGKTHDAISRSLQHILARLAQLHESETEMCDKKVPIEEDDVGK